MPLHHTLKYALYQKQVTHTDDQGHLYKYVGDQLWVLAVSDGFYPIPHWSKVEVPPYNLYRR